MIITRHWLNEWIDISGVSTDKLCKTFNEIGLEVDSVIQHRMPDLVVVGKVESKEKHPDAEKLSVCQVNVGDGVQQIVCGAKNVEAGQFVPVALVGAVLPGDFKIKPAKLRGLESNGMICSSTELGLPKINEGIMPLDSSIGTFKVGTPLSQIALLNDDVIELELTANRGDCLSIHGVARDLSVALELDLKELPIVEEEENLLGIGRVLSIQAEDKINSSFIYKALELKSIQNNVLMDLRLAQVDATFTNAVERVLQYVTYSTGVLMRAYDLDCFIVKNSDKAMIQIRKDANELDAIYNDTKRVAYVGISQEEECRVSDKTTKVIIEANYSHPDEISRSSAKNKGIASDRHLYRSSRGSEPDLNFGMEYFKNLMRIEKGIKLYAGFQQILQDSEEKVVSLGIKELAKMIGQEIPKNRVVQIFKALGFEVFFRVEQDVLNVKVPAFRHDVVNAQDLCEEIVRIVGIDNIASKPFVFAEKSRINTSYNAFQKRLALRNRAVAAGFFESVHYVFDDRAKMEQYGIRGIYKKRELSNPITNELNTLRATLLLHLLDAASYNMKNGRKRVPLFEIGRVFDHSRDESMKMGFVFSGEAESPSVLNHGKPAMINLMQFASKVGQVVGDIELQVGRPENKLTSPYEYANIICGGQNIGYLARVHVEVEREYDLPRTYICEVDFDAIAYGRKIAKEYSKFPASSRDLSLMVPKTMEYGRIRACLEEIAPAELSRFLPIDRYESEVLGDKVSLTIKLIFQDNEKTLDDERVSSMVDTVLEKLQQKLGITIR